jgi:hypothetical protein
VVRAQQEKSCVRRAPKSVPWFMPERP